jgi:iron complex outermembrane recepter protein
MKSRCRYPLRSLRSRERTAGARRVILLFVLGTIAPWLAQAAQPPQTLKALSIEQLMNLEITTVDRRVEAVGESVAAVSVITRDDIRRSGVTTIADALRLATGVMVAEANNGSWAVSARGFTATAAGKLLVMIDDVPMNSPLFRGLFWNTIDYALEDIERIEVIRGPVALWGANAVNGIVNVITRHSADTPGLAATLSSGTEDHALGEARYGATVGSRTWRAYGKVANRDEERFASGGGSNDGRTRGQVGFRLDGGGRDTSRWLVAGDLFHSREGVPDNPDRDFTTALVRGQGTRVLSPTSQIAIRSYYRREYRRAPNSLTHSVDTVAFDLQHSTMWAGRHTLVWGGGAGINVEHTQSGPTLGFEPADRNYALSTLFARNEFELAARVFVTLGAQIERNAFSGAAVQPSVGARVMLPRNQMVWGAVTRAIRRPTRLDTDVVSMTPTGFVVLRGNPDFRPEDAVATQAGYRVQFGSRLSFDAAVFRHDYSDLRSVEAPVRPGAPFVIGNTLQGYSQGVETNILLQPVPWLRTEIDYTWLDVNITRAPGSQSIGNVSVEANDPSHVFGWRTSLDLPRNVEADATLRTIGALPDPRVPAYTELGLRLGWHASPRTELFVVGDNLLHRQHPEFGADVPHRVEIERDVRAGVTFRF